MAISYRNTSPQQGDNQIQLLGKLLQLVGGTAEPGDTPETLLSRLVSLFGDAAGDFLPAAGGTLTGPLTLPSGDAKLRLGGSTSSFPSIGNSGALLRVRLADDSGWAVLQSGFLQANIADANNNTQPVCFEAYHETTGGGGSTNCGASIDFTADSSTTDRQNQCRLSTLWTDATHATRTSHLRVQPVLNGVTTEALRISNAQVDLRNSAVLASGGTQVVSSRKTGWTAPSGTAARTTFDTATVTTEELAKRVKALLDDLISHGLIGA